MAIKGMPRKGVSHILPPSCNGAGKRRVVRALRRASPHSLPRPGLTRNARGTEIRGQSTAADRGEFPQDSGSASASRPRTPTRNFPITDLMAASEVPDELRCKDAFHHIDMGFLNRRLCLSALPGEVRRYFIEHQKPGSDHMTVLANDHLLVTLLLDVCQALEAPPLLKALELARPKHLFRSTERLAPCPDIYDAPRVRHAVALNVDFGKPVYIAYHTSHLVSDTGKMILEKGAPEYVSSIVGRLHNRAEQFEIEPLVIGSPWFEHPRNRGFGQDLMWFGREFGEILPEDIEQFARMKEVSATSADEWMSVMRSLPEEQVKQAVADLLAEPPKKDWGGESDDHFSANVTVRGRRRTAAFLLKGPSRFAEMTLDMCGKRADQIHRMVDSDAEVCVVQHCHLIGSRVRHTVRTV